MKTEVRYIVNNFLDVTWNINNKVPILGYNPRFDTIRAVEVTVCD